MIINFIVNFIKGIFIGLALVIPGLSASTLAVVLGLFEKLIQAINNLRKETKKSLKFLLPIGLGTAVGVLASVGFLLFIIETFPIPGYAFFIGLVLGSGPVIYAKLKPGFKNKLNYGLLVMGLMAILLVGFLTPDGSEGGYITYIANIGHVFAIFGAGFISCFLIAFPGISGSIILLLIGQFETVYGAASNFADALVMTLRATTGAWDLGLNAFIILLIFFAGAITGLFMAARLIGALLARFEASVYFVVMGLILGAVYILYDIGLADGLARAFASGDSWVILRDLILAVASVVLGYICTRLMGHDKRSSRA
jgi:putative membrane protein